MTSPISPNTQAILLLTAPLIAGRGKGSADLLSPGEYKRLRRTLRDQSREPADLLGPAASAVFEECGRVLDAARLARLVSRGFLLSQAVDRWQARTIWVISRADPQYPKKLKARLKEDAPAILYGCGEAALLEIGGLAVVGSRDASDALLEYAEHIGCAAASAECGVISGGARGVDSAAMRGALAASGRVIGVLPDSLERAVLARDHRSALMGGRLVLVSPYDPAAGFNPGHAMNRNKLIYALADAGLIVNADLGKGGTWAGAVEQIDKLRIVPVYVRSTGEIGKGLDALRKKGALPWPNPDSSESFAAMLAAQVGAPRDESLQKSLFSVVKEPSQSYESAPERTAATLVTKTPTPEATPAEQLFAKVTELLAHVGEPKGVAAVASDLGVSRAQAQRWLTRLVKEGVLEKLKLRGRVRYQAAASRFEGSR
jgi:DNA processing protein